MAQIRKFIRHLSIIASLATVIGAGYTVYFYHHPRPQTPIILPIKVGVSVDTRTPNPGVPSPQKGAPATPGKKSPPPLNPDVLKTEILRSDYDSLASRFYAIEASLKERAKDLSTFPIKPEIMSAIETTRSDLAAAQNALSQGNTEIAGSRLDRARDTLKYLDSL